MGDIGKFTFRFNKTLLRVFSGVRFHRAMISIRQIFEHDVQIFADCNVGRCQIVVDDLIVF